MSDKFIIGFGTGRCGTKSFATLLSKQPGVSASHEGVKLPWKYDPEAFIQSLSQLLFMADGADIVCDVGFYWIKYLDKLINIFPKTKAVCLLRDKHEFVESWLNNIKMKDRQLDLFPDYDMESREDLLRYCNYYYKETSRLIRKYPKNISRIHYEYVLNEENCQKYILKSVGIPENNQVIKTDIVINSSNGRSSSAGNLIQYNRDLKVYEVQQHG